MRIQGLMVTGCLLLAGCAAAPVDTTPLGSTAVIRASSVFGGQVLPSVKGDETLYYRLDRKRSSNDYQFDNWILKHTMGHFMSGREEIVRLDSGLVWELDKKDRTYMECPLGGCMMNAPNAKAPSASPATRQESACKLTLKRSDLKSVPGGEHRTIVGLDTTKYTLSWVVELADTQGKLATNTVSFDFWTAEPTGTLKQVLAIADGFKKNYEKALPARNPNNLAINRDVYTALSKLWSKAGVRGEKAAQALTHELQKIKGHSLAVNIEWRAVDNTCGARLPTPTQQQVAPTAATPMGWLGQQAAQTMVTAPDPNEALLHYHYEVTGVALDPEHDSIFMVPVGYTLRQMKEQP